MFTICSWRRQWVLILVVLACNVYIANSMASHIYIYINWYIDWLFVCCVRLVFYYSKGNIPIFRKSSHTMFSSYSRPGFWYVTLIGISAQSGGNSWPTANPLNAPPQLSIPYVVPKELWTLNELKAALIRKFPHLSTEEGQGCQR